MKCEQNDKNDLLDMYEYSSHIFLNIYKKQTQKSVKITITRHNKTLYTLKKHKNVQKMK